MATTLRQKRTLMSSVYKRKQNQKHVNSQKVTFNINQPTNRSLRSWKKKEKWFSMSVKDSMWMKDSNGTYTHFLHFKIIKCKTLMNLHFT